MVALIKLAHQKEIKKAALTMLVLQMELQKAAGRKWAHQRGEQMD